MSPKEYLTARFYYWEQRGRGEFTSPFPTELEPDFYPFLHHALPRQEIKDDSRHHTVFSLVGELFRRKKTEENDDSLAFIPPVSSYEFECKDSLVVYRIAFPKDEKLSIEDMGHLLLMLSYTRYPLSFEIIANSAVITIQITCRTSDAGHVQEQISAYFPKAIIFENPEGLEILGDYSETCAFELALHEEFMRPLKMVADSDHD
jgi:hypothetical protein